MKFAGTRPIARLGLALVAVAALAGCSMFEDSEKSDTAKAAVGDCISVVDATTAETAPADCSSEQAVYKVMQVHDTKTECKEAYTSYEETLGGGTTAFLCLAPNFKEGACYNESANSYKSVGCAAPEASFRVIKRIDGEADEFACDSSAIGFRIVPDPKITYCLGSPKA